ncbi:uncharacterized protein LOC116019112 [Ipomoea triloba]|uniref:uncharacterized protein LOC116019112 n=1 Tax=Ipomoea triloba TaxID=35885 RepID=UPI00125E94FB|nr:uncharacterized protein LOC116019112 [Ipomoea triloba]
MESIEECNDNINFITGGKEEAAAGRSSAIFSELKLYCIQLLELHQNRVKSTSAVSQLLQLLRRSPHEALQPFFDYTLFPLLLLLDAAVDCRSKPNEDSRGRSIISNFPETPLKVGDILVEGVLNCLEELLKKCHLASVDQLVVLLKKLTRGALLSPLEASEEFREGVIRCFKALLLNLRPCSDDSCPCKKISSWPVLLEVESLQLPPFSKCDLKQEECLLAFLQSETASAAVGHWLSLLLKAADIEAGRELRGSATIRIECFTTLRMLIAKVGDGDALAFFLPGVVSQIGKVLHASKTMISGAAGSAKALEEAIRGLAEFLMIVLKDKSNLSSITVPFDDVPDFHSDSEKSPLLLLQKLRHLPNQMQDHGNVVIKDLTEADDGGIPVCDSSERGSINAGNMPHSLRVYRTKQWITDTSSHVDKLLSATFPHLCMHSSKRVRQGLLAAIQGLLTKCCYTLKSSRLMLLECLCILVCDDSEDVSLAAQAFFRYLHSSHGKHHIKHDFTQIFRRLIEKLPKVILENEESLAVSHARKLFVVIYFSGPQLVTDYLLQSPVTAAKFLDVFALCMSQNSVFAGSLEKRIITRNSSTGGYMRSIAEMKAIIDCNPEHFEFSESRKTKAQYSAESISDEYELPRMPPWFVHVGSQKLYHALAGILRLVGLSLFADSQSEGGLSIIMDVPLENLRKLISEVRMREYNNESWHSWYKRTASGLVIRRASTAACVLNEMLFGLSEQAIHNFSKMFSKSSVEWQELKHNEDGNQPGNVDDVVSIDLVWRICLDKGSRSQVVDYVGCVLHEYLSSEIWSLPIDGKDLFQQSHNEEGDMNLYFFHDTGMLHQVIIDGIGIFCMCLGKDFSSSGFLHSSLWLLLQNLICSNFLIRSASDAVLHIIAAMHEYETVGHLVLENSDYIIDSVCRELRHLDLNPNVPNILAAMLSYVGVAHKILPLLEEPMRAVSTELEILQRHRHPDLTISFLKAVAEIVKASKHEASSLPDQSLSFCKNVKSKMFDLEKKTGRFSNETRPFSDDEVDMDSREPGIIIHSNDPDMQIEEWESMLFKLNDSRRYRRTVGSMAGSCLIAATPLLSSAEHIPCLLALDIVEDGIFVIAKVEEAYKHEKESKEAIEHAFSLCSFHNLGDTLDDDETVENRLLPAANKIWPFLVSCVRNKNPLGVRRCMRAISNIVQICGGDFFSRRFHTDGVHLWNLLSTSPFQRRPLSKEKMPLLQLPYRGCKSSNSEDSSVAEASDVKVQVAVLSMLAELSKNRRSASALEAVLKKVCGLVVGVACSGVKGVQEAAINALSGLARMDPDLVWLLVADVYYSKKKDVVSPPNMEFPAISQILPPPSSDKQYLYVLYGGQSYGFDIDVNSVETVFRTLNSQVFTAQAQMYS